jgi:hypothetical protein
MVDTYLTLTSSIIVIMTKIRNRVAFPGSLIYLSDITLLLEVEVTRSKGWEKINPKKV